MQASEIGLPTVAASAARGSRGSRALTGAGDARRPGERSVVRGALLLVALAFVFVVVVLPVAVVVTSALARGLGPYVQAVTSPDTLAALRLTVLTAAITVPANTVFGLLAGWAIGKFEFRGKKLLTALIELPFAVSPVVSGLVFVLLLGPRTGVGAWLAAHCVHVIFAWPGVALATSFVTFPYVAREVITVMQAAGSEEEEAAIVLGASGWQTFHRVTLPKIKWGLLYGVILCNARAMGEFGAVSVVSGHIRGATNTLPLHVEVLYDEYSFSASFAVASLLLLLALVTMAAKATLDGRRGRTAVAPEEIAS